MHMTVDVFSSLATLSTSDRRPATGEVHLLMLEIAQFTPSLNAGAVRLACVLSEHHNHTSPATL